MIKVSNVVIRDGMYWKEITTAQAEKAFQTREVYELLVEDGQEALVTELADINDEAQFGLEAGWVTYKLGERYDFSGYHFTLEDNAGGKGCCALLVKGKSYAKMLMSSNADALSNKINRIILTKML